MSIIEKNISNFIESQFPEIYREEGPMFVEFAKKYYEWMEEANNTTYHSRRILDYKDIDDTVDNFVVKFKQKYLTDIQLDTVSQTRQLIKHSLDLYRAKGTERAIDLFFRAVFGKPAEVYYPGDDIFRLSDGKWVKPKYLEVTPSEWNVQFVGKQIVGVTSGATAFVERFIRRKIATKYINVFYISAIGNEFQTGELVTLVDQNLRDIPTVIGSLTSLDIVTGGDSFSVGDIVNLTSNNGLQGKARVAETSDIIGAVNFELIDSGWGYTANAEVIISEKVLTLQNVLTNANTTNTEFTIFETLKQPLANVVYVNANNTLNISNNDLLYTYYSNGSVAGMGRVLNWANNGSTNGEVYVAEIINTLAPPKEPAANLSGTISVSTSIATANGIGDVTSGDNTIYGTDTVFNADFAVGSIVAFFPYDANNDLLTVETKRITAVVSDTEATVDSDFGQTSAKVLMQILGNRIIVGTSTNFTTDFQYGDTIAIYSNATNYVMKTVNAVTNSTYLSIQEGMTFTNTAAKYANTKLNKYVYTAANGTVANIYSREDKSVTANVMGVSSNLTLYFTNTTGQFTNGQIVYQLNANNDEIANAVIIAAYSSTGTNAAYNVANAVGVFKPNTNLLIRSKTTSTTAKLDRVDLSIGVIDIVGSLIATENNFVYGLDSLSNSSITRISQGTLATFEISDTLQFSEEIQLSSELINAYANLPLNSVSFGFKSNPSANITTQYLDDVFQLNTYTIGGISTLVAVNPGKNYDSAPFITIYEPITAPYTRTDYNLEIANATGIFAIGEIITQDNGAKGQIISANLTSLIVKRLKFEDLFTTDMNVEGISSGYTANVIAISNLENVLPIGLNGIVSANVQTAKGAVTRLEVVDSGFGYIPGETVQFISNNGLHAGLAKAQLGKKGVSEGFYSNRNGFISDSKYVFDGEYYQEYSYEVRTSVTADKYAEMLKKVLHVAGTKAFSAVVTTTTANTSTNIIADITEE